MIFKYPQWSCTGPPHSVRTGNLIAGVCYVHKPGFPSLPSQSPSMVSIPPPTILDTQTLLATGMFAALTQRHEFKTLSPARLGKVLHSLHFFLAKAKIDVVKERDQVQRTEADMTCHFNCPSRNTVQNKGHLNGEMHELWPI